MKLILVTVFALIGSLVLSAQNITVSGVVVDEAGAPVPGAAVFVSGTTHGTMTGANGEFSLNVPASTKVLKCSCVGYEETEVPVENGKIRIVLADAVTFLEEAVAIGYGSPKKIESLVGSVTTVNSLLGAVSMPSGLLFKTTFFIIA